MRLHNLFEANRVPVIERLRSVANNPDMYISFTEINKLGINPQSEWYDPFAIYAYPVQQVLPQLEQHFQLFASTRGTVYLFESVGSTIELNDLTMDEVSLWLDKMIAKARPLLMNNQKAHDPEEWFYSLLQSWLARWSDHPGQALWLITGRMASYIERNNEGRDSRMVWNALFRSIGIDAVVDRGEKIIATNEPAQAAFFHRKGLQIVEAMFNDLK